jgi:putative transposase
MARQLRIEFEGAYYHVLSHGNNRCDIYRTDEDRNDFLGLLADLSDRFEIDIYAYVLMGNHYHLLLHTRKPNLSKAMQWLGTSYTRRFNVRNMQSGHLFQGRFKSIIVENDSYLMRLSCYIHRNPLRAGIVKRLADYKWSSYLYYAYKKKQPAWLKTDLILAQAGTAKDKHRVYRNKVQQYSDEKKHIRENVKFGLIYGSQEFINHIKDTYLSGVPDGELPQLNRMLREEDPEILIGKAAALLNWILIISENPDGLRARIGTKEWGQTLIIIITADMCFWQW